MNDFRTEIEVFKQSKDIERARAAQRAAFRLATGVDIEMAEAAEPDARSRIVARLRRLIERERLKGVARHWSYDLNRHIALGQAYAALASEWPGARGARDMVIQEARRRRSAPS